MKVAVVGATGLVGSKMIEVLQERNFPVDELVPVASEKSVGKKVTFKGREWSVVSLADGVAARPEIAIFSAGASVSKEWAPKFAEVGCRVIDNSSCWRMDPTKKLIVPEVNAAALCPDDMIIANPNCSTIQMVVALAPLHKAYKIKRVVVTTFQSVTGSGQKGINQMLRERADSISAAGSSISSEDLINAVASNGLKISSGNLPNAYPHQIDLNVLPHIDSFLENGYTKEEMKMVNETCKIFGDNTIAVTATTVRVPVTGGHSESVNVEFEKDFELKDVFELLNNAPGVIVKDDVANNVYPLPVECFGRDEVFVGRIRRDFSTKNALNFWCVADNLRKGAATNAVQIAELALSF